MKGIMFKEELFKKVVDGSKTQTRRTGGLEMANAILANGDFEELPIFHGMETDPLTISSPSAPVQWKGLYPSFYIPYSYYEDYFLKPRYQLNEIVYLKEPFYTDDVIGIAYKFGWLQENGKWEVPKEFLSFWDEIKWKNKMFMPERYARYFIKITNIRVERLYDISEQDAKAEGVEPGRLVGFGALGMKSFREGFFIKWIEMNKMKSFDTNPFVFAYDLELFAPPQ